MIISRILSSESLARFLAPAPATPLRCYNPIYKDSYCRNPFLTARRRIHYVPSVETVRLSPDH